MAGVRKTYGTARGAVRLPGRPVGTAVTIGALPYPETVKPFFFMSSTVIVCISSTAAENGVLAGDGLGERVLVRTVGHVHVGPEREAGRGVRDLARPAGRSPAGWRRRPAAARAPGRSARPSPPGRCPPSWTSMAVASGSVLSHAANFAAAALFLDPAVTAVVEPPQLPVLVLAGAPLRHRRHLPLALACRPRCRTARPVPRSRSARRCRVPSLSAAFHSGVYIGWLSTAPSADQAAPVVGDLLRGGVVDRDLPRVAVDAPPVRAGLLGQPDEPARVGRGEGGQVLLRALLPHRGGPGRRTRPRSSARSARAG